MFAQNLSNSIIRASLFSQPESRVLDEKEYETSIFQDFGDRWQNMLCFDKARKRFYFWYFLQLYFSRMELWDALYWQEKKEQLKDLASEDLLQALSTWNWQYQTTRGRQ